MFLASQISAAHRRWDNATADEEVNARDNYADELDERPLAGGRGAATSWSPVTHCLINAKPTRLFFTESG